MGRAKAIQTLLNAPCIPDTEQFKDKIATQTQWSGLYEGGATFATLKLIQINANRLKFIITLKAFLFYTMIFIVGIATLASAFAGTLEIPASVIVPFLLGCFFIGVFIYLMFNAPKSFTFDRSNNGCWHHPKKPTPLVNIHALQLICKYMDTPNSTYYSYELNLVLKDASRIHTVAHGDYDKILQDAQRVARFLDKPLWNAVVN
jgi:hypothetical protein